MEKREFETLEAVFKYIKGVDNKKAHGYQMLFDSNTQKWNIIIKTWTPFGMKYKWNWVMK